MVLSLLCSNAYAYVVAPAIPEWQNKPICRDKMIIDQEYDKTQKIYMFACQMPDGRKWVEIRQDGGVVLRMLFANMIEYNEFMLEWGDSNGSN
jgi:hypothetical protein